MAQCAVVNSNPDPSAIFVPDASLRRGGVLLVTDIFFWRQTFGSHRRVVEMARLLRDLAPLHVLFLGRPGQDDLDFLRQSSEFRDIVVTEQLQARLSWPRRLWLEFRIRAGQHGDPGPASLLRAVFHGVRDKLLRGISGSGNTRTATLHDYLRSDHALSCREWIERLQPDYLVVEYVRLAYVLSALDPPVRARLTAIVDTHDVMWRRHLAFERAGLRSDLRITARQEAAQLARFDRVLAIQRSDAAELQEMVGKTVFLVPHPQDIEALPDADADPVEIAFVGSSMTSNADGLRHFAGSIWPKVSPDVRRRSRVGVYGGVCGVVEKESLPEEFVLKGHVPDLRSAYGAASIIINPVRAGGGLKIKSVEALCYGRCLVTAASGAEGLEDGAGTAYLLARTDAEFAELLERAIEDRDLRNTLGACAVKYASLNFARDEVRRKLRQAMAT